MKGLLIISLAFNVVLLTMCFCINERWYRKSQEMNLSWYKKSIELINSVSDSGEEQNENQTDGMLYGGDSRN